MSNVTFETIYLGDSSDQGRLRFNAAGFGWKSYKDENNQPTTFSGSDIRGAQWFRVARNFQLRLHMRHSDRPRVTFDGFARDDQDKVKRTLDDYYNIKLETRDPALKGYNWGKAIVQSNDIEFLVQNKTAFEIPLSAVANSNIAGKNEVAVELTPGPAFQRDPTNLSARVPDEMVEIRFFVPGKSVKARGSDAGSDEEDEIEVDEEGNEITAAEAMHAAIAEKADLGTMTGDSIVSFSDVLILTPRGRYTLDFYPDSVRLLGKSTDYRVPFTNVRRLFLLPKLDDLHVQLVIGLDPPIRQGATRYPFLVLQWPKDEEVDAELALDDEELAKYPGLDKKYDAPSFTVVSQVFKSFTQKRVTPPGSFRNAQGLNGIKANVKAAQGELYFLDKGLIFIAKQPILIDFSKTESIAFSRVGGGVASAKTFDMRVVSRTETQDHVFSAISKEEVQPISAFLQSKGVKLKNEMEEVMDLDPVSDDDDDEDASIPSEDEGRSKKSKPAKKAANDEDEESEDEDFAEESSDGGSPSDTDSDSEASDAGSDVSDPILEAAKKKAAKIAERKKAQGTGGGSDDEKKPKKKKQKMDVDE